MAAVFNYVASNIRYSRINCVRVRSRFDHFHHHLGLFGSINENLTQTQKDRPDFEQI